MEEWKQKYPTEELVPGDLNGFYKAAIEGKLELLPGKTPGPPRYDSVFVKASPKQTRNEVLQVFRNVYLHARQKLGGRLDPYFWGTEAKQFEGLDPKNVGIVEVEGFLPFSLDEAKTMNEDRLWREEEGYMVVGGLNEVRLAKDRFHKLVIRDDLLRDGK